MIVALISVVILSRLLGVDPESLTFILSIALIAHTLMFFGARHLLNKKQSQWKIALKKDEKFMNFEGGEFFRLYMGYFWRMIILNRLTESLATNLIGDADPTGVSMLIVSFAGIYLAVLWLLKAPYGAVAVAFNVTHTQEGGSQEVMDSEKFPPVQINEKQKEKSSESVFAAFKNVLTGSFAGLFYLGFLGVGLVQWAAIFDFFHEGWGWWYIPSLLIAGFVAYIPLIGSVLGFYAAYDIWEWSAFWSFLLFFWPLVLMTVALLGALIESFSKK